MTRRLSLAGQLLALQVVIICVVLVGVAAVSVAQAMQRGEQSEGRRAPAVAETLANARATRASPGRRGVRLRARGGREHAQRLGIGVGRGGAADRTVIASADPGQLGARSTSGRARCSRVAPGWGTPTSTAPGRGGHGPDPAPRGRDVLGFVAVVRPYPGVLDALADAAPNLLPTSGWPASSASSARCWSPGG